MSEPFLGEIRMMGFNFAPRGWAFCNGQLISIAQNTALFSLLGTFYGGNGQTNYALPNLQGLLPMHQGAGPGLTPRDLGETGGSYNVTLLQSEMPAHTHSVNASSAPASSTEPGGNVLARSSDGLTAYNSTGTTTNAQVLDASVVTVTGGSQPHSNMMPSLTLNFCIALQGVFPSRN